MASNLISRLLPSRDGEPSVYETLRAHDEPSDSSDLEERAGMALDEENLGERFEDYELDHAEAARMMEESGQTTVESTAFLGGKQAHTSPRRTQRSTSRPKWMGTSRPVPETDEGDDEVPLSLLTEEANEAGIAVPDLPPPPSASSPVPGPSDASTRARWEAAQAQQMLQPETRERGRGDGSRRTRGPRSNPGLTTVDPKEKALWRWANVGNLDNFLKDVYDYFLGNGIWCIVLSRVLNLMTLAFVVGFSTFLTMCVDYKKVPQSKTMGQILIPQCTKKMSGTANFFLWLFALFWIAKVLQYIVDIRRLRHMHDFYLYLLDVNDSDIQTISWQEVVARLMTLRDANPVTADGVGQRNRKFMMMGNQSKQRMDAHDIANRLMRKENYLIALFNKDILDLTLPIPFLRNRQLFSKTLEWNLNLCILDYVFNEQGQVRPLFLKDTHRRKLSDGLRRRFLFAGVMNVVCAPFIVIYLMMLYFFRYFTEYQRNPSQIGSRQYTPLAEWKFREFNELWHLFQRRINMSYPFASRYIDQFPKDKTVQLSRFVAFITGALAAVLAVASVVDPELFLGFEITPERTVLFYLGLFGTVWAVARGAVPEETLVFDPEFALNNVTEYTRYMPAEWRGRLHSDEVRREFALLYQMKVVIFLEEILSIIFTPFVLWFSLPRCSDRLVDFFREFTVHVDGLGYVCSFAVFDFKRGGVNNVAGQKKAQEGSGQGLRDEYYSTKDGKMLASYFGFLDNYATDPRLATRRQQQQHQQLHPPPVPGLPGLTSPTLAADAGAGARRQQPQQPYGPVQRASTRPGTSAGGMHSTHRMPRLGPLGAQGLPMVSPMPSMLLDPHHQPTPSRHASGSRHRASRRDLLEEAVEDDVGAEGRRLPMTQQGAGAASTASGGMGGDSLGESWKTTRAALHGEDEDGLDEEEEEDVDTVAGEKGAGVLGLLYQFQKAQAEGRGGGVSI
ncbi:MAG: autophagy protein atg9 [Thelocarpon impressellum]|nr:MAG: autophagy protein atg9 [Thelocarpon impressellum]